MVKTEPTSFYEQLSITTRNEYLEFKVAACRDSRLALFQELSPTNTNYYYEVGIGFTDNTQMYLFDSKQGKNIALLTIMSMKQKPQTYLTCALEELMVKYESAIFLELS